MNVFLLAMSRTENNECELKMKQRFFLFKPWKVSGVYSPLDSSWFHSLTGDGGVSGEVKI